MHLSEKEKVLRRTDKQQSKLWDALEKEKMKGEHITGGLHDYWEPGQDLHVVLASRSCFPKFMFSGV